MPRVAYVNGRFVSHDTAQIHIEDRGFQFADGVYEVIAVVDGKPADADGHLERLGRSLGELRIAWPVKPATLRLVMRELLARNRLRNALVYIQVTRGVAPRDFRFPVGVAPSLVLTCRRTAFQSRRQVEEGVGVITLADIRWLRRDIKSVGLLAQVLGKQQAFEQGAFEGWMLAPDGTVTEGCSSNAWIVTADGVLVTRSASNLILNGITRQSLIALAGAAGIPVVERPFTPAEAQAAREAFLSSAGNIVLPIVRIDGLPVANGHPGEVARSLRAAYFTHVGATDPVLR